MHLRRYFLTGLAALLPLGLTALIVWFVVAQTGGRFGSLLRLIPALRVVPHALLTVAGFVLLIVFIVLVGFVTSGLFGRWAMRQVEQAVLHLPFVKGLYASARQLTDAVFVDRTSLKRAVIAQYPRRGLYAIGFVTWETPVELARGTRAWLVFFPTTPNPTTGWLALVPEHELAPTGVTVDEALKLVVSGGMISPESVARLVRPPSRARARPRRAARSS